ncbi:unnamed protein product [Didymodactylos carnosus]|uniref:Uncharacterized protein n=1 Tax=Didymodactylos carnosus TaxID=1234261 RepID=A0A815BBJ2_9BILA|nr:unnamed protein product [Didymodactylos carnosus]CAF1267844.1 unnamed protein product [Didymodactylos carnosus]CAF4052895.1 unnamed protein product [Didymodactylos carnosus]CAF4057531.1 unnamed protein product [Didymodactylos carnosus]
MSVDTESAITLVKALIQQIDREQLIKAVNTLLKCYNKNSTIISGAAVAISILALLDSLNDMKLKDKYCKQLLTALDPALPEQFRTTRLREIKEEIISLRDRQMIAASVKGIVALAFLGLGFGSVSGGARCAMFAASGITGVASLINVYNYRELDLLLEKMKADGLLD